MSSSQREKFYQLYSAIEEERTHTLVLPKQKYDQILNYLLGKDEYEQISKMEKYRWKNRYTIQVSDGQYFLLFHGEKAVVYREQLFDVLHVAHMEETRHGGRDAMINALKDKHHGVSRKIINVFLKTCADCKLKKTEFRKSTVTERKKYQQKPVNKGGTNQCSVAMEDIFGPIEQEEHRDTGHSHKSQLVVKPTPTISILNYMIPRAQMGLIYMQSEPDRNYKFILTYQDCLTKFVALRPLETNRAKEIADHLVDIFCERGSPVLLHADNGQHEFCRKVIDAVLVKWPGIKLIPGNKPMHLGSMARCNQEIREMLACWMADNNSNQWAHRLRFVQWQYNSQRHDGIGQSPFEAMFGRKPGQGLRQTGLPDEIVAQIRTEEQLEEALGKFAPSNLAASTSNIIEERGETIATGTAEVRIGEPILPALTPAENGLIGGVNGVEVKMEMDPIYEDYYTQQEVVL